MDFQLAIVRGRSASGTIKLGDGVTTVGRHDDCQLRIKSSQVSRKHCELFEKKGLLLVKDLGSSNGTYVNGKRIEGQRVLELGDELTIGQVTLKVAKAGVAAPRAQAQPALKPNDTAVVEAVAADSSNDVEFDIDFDEDLETPEAFMDSEEHSPLSTTPPPTAKTAPAPAPAPAAKAAPEPPPKDAADDAVADFLLDIKFDEDE